MADRVVVYILDPDGTVVGQVDQASKFSATARWQDLGAVSVTCRAESPAAPELQRGARLAVLVDGVVFASGPLARIVTDTDNSGVFIEASGPDDLTFLDGSIGYTAAPSLNPTGAVTSDLSGPAMDVIYGYVDRNVGPSSASAGRQHVTLAPSLHVGSTVNESVRFESILTVAKRVAIVDGLGLRCRWDPVTRSLPVFEVAESRDLRDQIEFSAARGTISRSTVTDAAPGATHVLVGGAGDGTARVFAQVNDDPSAAAWYRIEQFVDAGDVSDVATLTQRAEAAMQQGGITIELEAIETEGMRFGDWQIGDLVTGKAAGYSDVFVVVQIELSGPPLRFKPTLSQFAGYRTGQLQAVQQRILAERLRSQETN